MAGELQNLSRRWIFLGLLAQPVLLSEQGVVKAGKEPCRELWRSLQLCNAQTQSTLESQG